MFLIILHCSISFAISVNLNVINQLKRIEVIDSIKVNLTSEYGYGRVEDISWGRGFIWGIRTLMPFLPVVHSIVQINVEKKEIVKEYENVIPGNRIDFVQGFCFDSLTVGGPFFWYAQGQPPNRIYKIDVENFKVIDSIDSPQKWPSDVLYYNDTLWICSWYYNTMDIYDLKSKYNVSIYNIRTNVSSFALGRKNKGEFVLWLAVSPLGEEKYLQVLNLYTGNIIDEFILPNIEADGIIWENESIGGPFLWISDISSNYIYKIKDPLITDVKYYHFSKNNIFISSNPFSEKTKISFNLENPAYTKLTIYNSLGYVIDVLADEYLIEGMHEFTFDGSAFANGAYFLVLQSGGKVETGKLVLIK